MWVEWGSTLSAIRLHPLASLTSTDISVHILYHVHPPVGLQESTLHLLRTRVSSSREVVFMVENTLSYLCWHPCNAAISSESCAVPRPSIIKFVWLGDIYRAIFLE